MEITDEGLELLPSVRAGLEKLESSVGGVVRGIRQSGRQPVLLGARRRQLKPYGAAPRQIMALRTTQDSHTLINPPRATWKLIINIWMSEPPR